MKRLCELEVFGPATVVPGGIQSWGDVLVLARVARSRNDARRRAPQEGFYAGVAGPITTWERLDPDADFVPPAARFLVSRGSRRYTHDHIRRVEIGTQG